MGIKIFCLILMLLLASPTFAQQPRIDSIAVDEEKGKLVLHGIFQNSASAVVTVDSVSLPVILASDTMVRATIPVSGKGSSGQIVLNINGKESNKKLLTYLHFYAHHLWRYNSSPGYSEFSSNDDNIHIRLDFSNFPSEGSFALAPSLLSNCNDVASGSKGYGGPTFDSSGIFRQSIIYSPSKRLLKYNIDFWGHFSWATDKIEVTLDESYQPIPKSYSSLGQSSYSWGPIAPTDFAPLTSSVYKLSSNPNIIHAHLSSNPIASHTEAIITLHEPTKIQMQIMDILGHIISSEEKMLQLGESKLPINSSALPPGIYICRLQAGGEVVSVRFVKKSN